MSSTEDPCATALQAIGKSKDVVAKSSVGAILKILKALQKSPDDPKNRKTRMENIIIKKYITEVPGALDFMKGVGFETSSSVVDSKPVAYLQIEQIDNEKLNHAIELLESKLKEVGEAVKAPKAPAARTVCAGGCGYWGDENQENYCSLCFKKKYLGVKEPTSSSSSSSSSGVPKSGKCIKDCGNFGSEKFGGMCSQCHSKQQSTAPKAWKRRLRIAFIKIRAVHRFNLGKREEQTNKSRCWKCKRKIGITGIECRCGYVFCGKHRYADEHDCSFDHKRMHRKKLERENKLVVAKKFDKVDDDT